MRNSFVKINKNDVLFCGRSNSEIGIFVRYKVICDNLEIDALTWEQICANFTPKERKVVLKFFGDEQKKFGDEQKKFGDEQKNSKIGLEKEHKNSELDDFASCAYANRLDQTRPDQTIQSSDKSSDCIKREKKIKTDEIVDFETLFTYWEQNKKGGRYKTAESRNRQFEKLKRLTNDDLGHAKEAIFFAVDNNYQGFTDGSRLYYRSSVASGGSKTQDDDYNPFHVEIPVCSNHRRDE